MIQVIHTILLIVYIIVCVALTIIVLMQEGKQAGLTGAKRNFNIISFLLFNSSLVIISSFLRCPLPFESYRCYQRCS